MPAEDRYADLERPWERATLVAWVDAELAAMPAGRFQQSTYACL